MSIPTEPNNGRAITLVFWRRGANGIDFLIPLYGSYAALMRHVVTGDPATGGRASSCKMLNLNPRSNARVFYVEEECYVAFQLNNGEVAQVDRFGVWGSSAMVNPTLGMALMDIARQL